MLLPNEFQKRTISSALTGLAIVLLGAIVVGLVWLGGKVLGYLQPVLVPLAVAGIIAYLLDPVVSKLELKHKLSRLKSVLLVFVGLALILGLLGLFIVPPIVKQTGDLLDEAGDKKLGRQTVERLEQLRNDIPGARNLVTWLIAPVDNEGESLAQPYPFPEFKKPTEKSGKTDVEPKLKGYFDEFGQQVEQGSLSALQRKAIQDYRYPSFGDRRIGYWLTKNSQYFIKTALNWLKASTKVFGFIGYLFGFLLVPVYLFYFLSESGKIKTTWHNYIPLKASKFKDEVVSTLSEINSYLISFFRGQVLVSLIDGLLVGVALSIFQLPYGFLIGIALAILGILPFIGNILCMIPAVLIAFIHFGGAEANHQWLGTNPWAYVAAVLAIFIVVQNINSLITAPKIVGDSVGLHPMTVIFSIFFWSLLLGGFLGALLAVPLTAAVKVLFSRYIWQARVSPQLGQPLDISTSQEQPSLS